MSIDWITVGAQIVNFLVLIWLLKKFLYRPILDGIDAREAEISERMGEAAAVRTSAEVKEAEYKAQIAELSASRAEMLENARRKADAERDALLAETRTRLEKEQAEREARRAEEARAFTEELHQNGAQALLDLTRKALADLADETLEQRIALHAAGQLKDMADNLRDAAGDSCDATVLTRDPLPEDVQDRLRDELAAILPDFRLRFDTDAGLSPGLNLRLGGAQVGWTTDSYLSGLDAVLEDRVGRPIRKGLTDAA
ncbi:F0F1 ATP synthase subunit B [Aliiroseovarius sp. S1339]|uniref:F0F1 ATP synthase subunit B family protein n=1 Tax=Aliiroseovarius sp. S1339 TaxID=2936990 RepID=UPI0020BEEA0F|nr:F0F1 ATP synthase subunit B [Aliiroseovarius sp. S1339]MCK8465523.1 F0F1 ATP synthase subunit B [Aliiroseovarius sp. S1339]